MIFLLILCCCSSFFFFSSSTALDYAAPKFVDPNIWTCGSPQSIFLGFHGYVMVSSLHTNFAKRCLFIHKWDKQKNGNFSFEPLKPINYRAAGLPENVTYLSIDTHETEKLILQTNRWIELSPKDQNISFTYQSSLAGRCHSDITPGSEFYCYDTDANTVKQCTAGDSYPEHLSVLYEMPNFKLYKIHGAPTTPGLLPTTPRLNTTTTTTTTTTSAPGGNSNASTTTAAAATTTRAPTTTGLPVHYKPPNGTDALLQIKNQTIVEMDRKTAYIDEYLHHIGNVTDYVDIHPCNIQVSSDATTTVGRIPNAMPVIFVIGGYLISILFFTVSR